MPLQIDRSTESALSTLFDDAFMRSLTQYLGIDPDTPSEDMPLSVNELLEEAISSCEQEQWRLILPKTVTLTLPTKAFCDSDNLLFLPLGKAQSFTIAYLDSESVSRSFTDFTSYVSEVPKLYSKNWSTLRDACLDSPYPITVTYSPGYTNINQIPKSTIRALKILTCHNFEYRGTEAPIPEAYKHNMNLGWLNNERANKWITDSYHQGLMR